MVPRKLWPVALVAAVWWGGSATPEAPAAAAAPEELRLMPLAGDVSLVDGDRGAILDELVRHPHWTLGVTTALPSCFQWNGLVTYEVHADGAVVETDHGATWDEVGDVAVTRAFALTPDELAAVRGAGRLDTTAQVAHAGMVWVRLGRPGVDGLPMTGTVLGETLVAILERAAAR